MQSKKELRKYFFEQRAGITEKAVRDRKIAERVLADKRVRNADTILIYASFRSEADTWELAEKLISTGKKLAFPLCGKDGVMTFHSVSSTNELVSGAYGIREPKAEFPQPEYTSDTVCLVPGLAFTVSGGRLGYGGGYYDRFLSANPQICTIALTYEQLITAELPLMEHDLRMGSIITEERTVFCNAEER